MAQAADRAFLQQCLHLEPDRRVCDHEGFGYDDAGAVTHRNQILDLLCLEGKRLFDQHMLAGLGCLGGPFDMLAGGQRDIDRIDKVGCQHLVIGAEGMRCAEAVAEILRLLQITAGKGRDDAVFGILNGRCDKFTADLGRRQNSEAQHWRFSPLLFPGPAYGPCRHLGNPLHQEGCGQAPRRTAGKK